MNDGRRRVALVAIAAGCAALGVAGKHWTGPGRAIAVGQFEDFFGTLFLILIPRAVFLRARFAVIAAPVLAIVCAIELSQLFDGELLTRVRGTWLGLHVLGAVFEWMDLLAYALAGVAAWAIDRRLTPRRS